MPELIRHSQSARSSQPSALCRMLRETGEQRRLLACRFLAEFLALQPNKEQPFRQLTCPLAYATSRQEALVRRDATKANFLKAGLWDGKAESWKETWESFWIQSEPVYNRNGSATTPGSSARLPRKHLPRSPISTSIAGN